MALSFPDGIKERKKVGEGKRKERGTRERERKEEESKGGKKKGWQVSTSCSVSSSCKSAFTGRSLPLGVFSQADIPSLSNQRECRG